MKPELERLLPLLSHVQGHLDEDVSLRELAREMLLSEFHLHRVFSRAVGETTKQYTSRLRLDRAAAALLSSDDSILDIALASGFSSHEVFIRSFQRRFGMSPRQYRRRGLASGADSADSRRGRAHADLVRSVGPCIGLVGAGRDQPTSEGSTMSYTIEKKSFPGQPLLFMRRRVKQSEIAKALGEVLPRVFEYAQKSGAGLAGPPVCRYAGWGPLLTIEAGMPVASAAVAVEPIEAGSLHAGAVAMTVHHGGYDGLGEAHAAVQAWIERQGIETAGPPWESYVTDPGQVPDPKDWKTEVYWPIRG